MLQRITICIVTLLSTSNLYAQEYQKLPSSLEYKFIKVNPENQLATIGSEAQIHIITKIADSVVFDSRKINNNVPVPAQVAPAQFNGDLQEGFAMMHEGDIAFFRAPIDSVIRDRAQMPAFAQSGDWMSCEVEMAEVKTKEEIEAEAKLATEAEELAIKKYIKENKLDKKVFKTASGLYYVITKAGTGANAQVGQTVSMNYTGYLLNGNVFDSNVDSSFNHVEPFEFPLGQGRVIKGWDEGIALLNKGAKAKLIIPSRLGYGSRAMGEKIPANSVLVFDVEMLGTK